MDNKKIAIILLAILAIAIVAFVAFSASNIKEDSKIKITSNKTLYENSTLKVKLTDLNKTPIANGTINVTIKDKNGKEKVKKAVKTNSKGVAKLDLNLKKGKYNVTAIFEGNDNFTGNNTTQKLTIKEKVKKANTSSYNSYNSEPVYDGHTVSYKDGQRGVYSYTGEFFIDPTQDPSYQTF